MNIKRQIYEELETYRWLRPYLARGLAEIYEELSRELKDVGEVVPQFALFEMPNNRHVFWLLTVIARDAEAAKRAVMERIDALLKRTFGLEDVRRLRTIAANPKEGRIYVDLVLDEIKPLLFQRRRPSFRRQRNFRR